MEEGSASRFAVISHGGRSERKLHSSSSAILSSFKSTCRKKKNKFEKIHVVSNRLVPSGPNPLHN
ncbi:CLE10 protein [Senna tora]|uniref:CLE10 protein n=1 Tax=Senna tora TaxID=362788 RepID=A0A834T254_9FABA|nr:CLE10 protein [Senna tora]